MRTTTNVCWWGIVVLSAACASVVLGGAIATLISGGVGASASPSALDLVVLVELGGLQVAVLLLMVTHRGSALSWSTAARVGRTIAVVVAAASLAGYSIQLAATVMSGLTELVFVLGLLALLPRGERSGGFVGAREHAVKNQRGLFVGHLLREGKL